VEHGLLVVIPKGLTSSSRSTSGSRTLSTRGSLFFRLLVIAEEGSSATLIEEYASATPELAGYTNAVAELFVEQGAKLEYVSLQNLSRRRGTSRRTTRRSAATPSSTGLRRLRLEEGQDADPERPRRPGRDVTRDRRVLRRRHAAPRLRHVPGAHRAEHDVGLRLQGRPARRGDGGLARDDPRREGRAEDERVPGEPEPDALEQAHADSIPGLEILANDVRCTHGATLGQVDREQLFYLMARGLSRAEAERLIVRGFFQDILDRIELEPVRETLGEALEARIPQA
jgi:Fe-S cluster assembly protein SufD